MSLVRPFRARVYRHEPGDDVTTLVAPPYDVVSPEERSRLLERDPHNIVAVELPEGPSDPNIPGNRYENAARIWREWYEQGILVDDEAPSIYVLEQSWGSGASQRKRRGFVAAVRLHPFDDGVIVPHERTLPKAIADRLSITRATAANLSSVFGLFVDPDHVVGHLLDAATSSAPMLEASDSDGVVARVWAVTEKDAVGRISSAIGQGPIFIADGHHRYTTALAYRDERRAADAAAGIKRRDPAYDFVMMTLVDMDDPGLVVMPTHRLAWAQGAFDPARFWSELVGMFDLQEPAGPPQNALASAPRTSFVVRTSDGTTRLATLKEGLDPAALIPGEHSDAWKRLDVTVLQELVLKPIFGIDPDLPESLERLSFVKTDAEALTSNADAAFLLAPTPTDTLREVALAGDTMPQKSTYFYPKLPSGLLMRSLD